MFLLARHRRSSLLLLLLLLLSASVSSEGQHHLEEDSSHEGPRNSRAEEPRGQLRPQPSGHGDNDSNPSSNEGNGEAPQQQRQEYTKESIIKQLEYTHLQENTCAERRSTAGEEESCKQQDDSSIRGDDERRHGHCDSTSSSSTQEKSGTTNDSIVASHGVPQTLGEDEGASENSSAAAAAVIARMKQVDKYMFEQVYVNETFPTEVKTACRNRHEECTFWAVEGECEKNPAYMTIQCAPACFSCDRLDFKATCPFDDDETRNEWQRAGDLNRFFERLTGNPNFQRQYSLRILSRPATTKTTTSTIAETNGNDLVQPPPPHGPWIVQLDHFLSPTECDHLIALGHEQGYRRSTGVGERNLDGSYRSEQIAARTSSTAWCAANSTCGRNATARAIAERVEALTNISRVKYEPFQLLRYEAHEHYGAHHDYVRHHLERAQGVRILTLLLYLNTVNPSNGGTGGETYFSNLDIAVAPVRGRALLWPNVFDLNRRVQDPRTKHAALPVLPPPRQGSDHHHPRQDVYKYAANAWIHQRDFVTPHQRGCS